MAVFIKKKKLNNEVQSTVLYVCDRKIFSAGLGIERYMFALVEVNWHCSWWCSAANRNSKIASMCMKLDFYSANQATCVHLPNHLFRFKSLFLALPLKLELHTFCMSSNIIWCKWALCLLHHPSCRKKYKTLYNWSNSLFK